MADFVPLIKGPKAVANSMPYKRRKICCRPAVTRPTGPKWATRATMTPTRPRKSPNCTMGSDPTFWANLNIIVTESMKPLRSLIALPIPSSDTSISWPWEVLATFMKASAKAFRWPSICGSDSKLVPFVISRKMVVGLMVVPEAGILIVVSLSLRGQTPPAHLPDLWVELATLLLAIFPQTRPLVIPQRALPPVDDFRVSLWVKLGALRVELCLGDPMPLIDAIPSTFLSNSRMKMSKTDAASKSIFWRQYSLELHTIL